jgi:hypothetical protein
VIFVAPHFCRALGTTLPALMTAFEERLAQKRPRR